MKSIHTILAVIIFAVLISCFFPGCTSTQSQQQRDLEMLYQMKQYDIGIQELETQALANRAKLYNGNQN